MGNNVPMHANASKCRYRGQWHTIPDLIILSSKWIVVDNNGHLTRTNKIKIEILVCICCKINLPMRGMYLGSYVD